MGAYLPKLEGFRQIFYDIIQICNKNMILEGGIYSYRQKKFFKLLCLIFFGRLNEVDVMNIHGTGFK